MITTQVESFIDRLDELKPLLPVHWAELALNKDKVPLDPQYEVYFHRERCGELLFVTLREDGRLIGYFIAFIAPGLHYKTCLTCHMDIFYVHPDHRTKMGGFRLVKAVKKELIRRGVHRWFVGEKEHAGGAGRLFEAMGFKKVETTYSMWLGD